MTKKQAFINEVSNLLNGSQFSDPDAQAYWDGMISQPEEEKPMFTDNGKMILKYMQDNADTQNWKAKDIGEGIFASSRTVSGAIRKLVTDGFVDKVGQDPVVYSLTEKGKTITIE